MRLDGRIRCDAARVHGLAEHLPRDQQFRQLDSLGIDPRLCRCNVIRRMAVLAGVLIRLHGVPAHLQRRIPLVHVTRGARVLGMLPDPRVGLPVVLVPVDALEQV